MTALRLAIQVVSIELRRTFTYRFEFWFRFLGTLFANVALAYFLWKAIFAQTGAHQIEGYTFPAMVFYYVLVPLVINITRTHESGFMAGEIYTGTLTRYLVFPMSFFVYKYASTVASTLVGVLQLGIIVAGYALIVGFPAELQLTPASFAMGLSVGILAGALNFYIMSCIEMVAFWADNIWSLGVMFMFLTRLLGGAMLPLAMFPDTVQQILPFTPFPYLISFPVLSLMGRVSLDAWLQGILVMVVWMVAFALLQQLIWKRGSVHYAGVGI